MSDTDDIDYNLRQSMTPNRELQKAIDRIENEISLLIDQEEPSEYPTFRGDIKQLLSTAKQLQQVEKERDELKAQNLKMRQRNLVNAVGRICQDCGHEKSEDGCANCINAKYAEEVNLWRSIYELFGIVPQDSTPNQVFEQFQQLSQLRADFEKVTDELKHIHTEVNQISNASYKGSFEHCFRTLFYRVESFREGVNKALSTPSAMEYLKRKMS